MYISDRKPHKCTYSFTFVVIKIWSVHTFKLSSIYLFTSRQLRFDIWASFSHWVVLLTAPPWPTCVLPFAPITQEGVQDLHKTLRRHRPKYPLGSLILESIYLGRYRNKTEILAEYFTVYKLTNISVYSNLSKSSNNCRLKAIEVPALNLKRTSVFSYCLPDGFFPKPDVDKEMEIIDKSCVTYRSSFHLPLIKCTAAKSTHPR